MKINKAFYKVLITIALFWLSTSYADETEDMLEKLSNTYGVSGFEQDVRALLIEYWKDQKIDFSIDGMGNLVGKLPSHSEKKPSILLMAHMDEVGFLTSKINDQGFISVNPLGGWLNHVLWSQRWVIRLPNGEYIPAISGMDPPHVLTDYTKTPVASKGMLFLDTGISKEQLVSIGIRPGLSVTPDIKFNKFGNKRYLGKAFDDRAGLAVMIDIMKAINKQPALLKKINIVFAATVQEELGMRGSKAVYESLKPDLVLNIEAGIARDYPVQFTNGNQPGLGLGPAIFIYDGSMMPNHNLVEKIAQIAEDNKIPIQWELENSYGQDASCLQSAGKGMPAVNIGIPVRYAHSHAGIIDRDDYDHTLQLILSVLSVLDEDTIKRLP